MYSWSLPILLLTFGLAAGAVWKAGIWLSDTTDVLSDRLHLGEALGGLLLLAIATNLPEIAITVSAARSGHLDIAVGNLLGGVAVQTVVLVLLDAFGGQSKPRDETPPLMYRVASLAPVLEAALVVVVLTLAVMGTQFPATLIVARMAPESLLIAVLWIAGVELIGKARTGLPWQPRTSSPAASGPGVDAKQAKREKQQTGQAANLGRTVALFAFGAVVTLIAGVVLEKTGEEIADHIHLNGVLFGATVLAAATSLPELSTGLASVRLGDDGLAVSDIFGGNAFLPVLFLVADLLSGQATLAHAGKTDIYLAGLGILLTAVYIYGLIFRPRRRILRMGIDSLAVLIFYLVGMVGLFALPH